MERLRLFDHVLIVGDPSQRRSTPAGPPRDGYIIDILPDAANPQVFLVESFDRPGHTQRLDACRSTELRRTPS